MNVSSLIAETARRFGERVAVIEIESGTESRRIRYEELGRKVLGFVLSAQDLGLRAGDRIAVLMDNSVELIVSEWACLSAAFIWVSVNARTSADELAAILGDCVPKILLVADGYRDVALAARRPAGCGVVLEGTAAWSSLFERDAPKEYEVEAPEPDAPVRIRYTSGTAGVPKGAVLTRACYDASVQNVAAVLHPLDATDTVLQVAPMTHASGAMLLPHAAVGARAVILRRFDVEAVLTAARQWRATSVFLVPTMLIRLLERIEDGRALSSLKTIVYGGAAMPVDRLKNGLAVLGGVFVQIYGLTESTWPVCALSHEDHLRRVGESEPEWDRRLQSCGRPTAVGELRIVGADGRDCEPAAAGEVWVRGRNTMRGYWRGKSSVATRREDLKGLDGDGWMHTGDVGSRDREGYVTIVDRLHDMIVSGGFNVYPREVETALSSHPAVLESAVVGAASAEWGETVHADVVLRPGRHVSAEDLIRHCASTLPGYKKPRSIEFVDALPKNAAGKILRRLVRERRDRRRGGTED